MHPDEPGYVREALAAVTAAGVARVVYHSVASPYAPEMPHHLGKAVSEDLVRRSGLAWTILQPGAYLQNLDLSGPVEVPYDIDAVFGFADLNDVAAVAALVLTESGHVGATYELASRVASVAELAAEAGVEASRVDERPTDGSARCSPTTTPMGCRSRAAAARPAGRGRSCEMRVLIALGGNAMTTADGRARPEDQIAAAEVAMAVGGRPARATSVDVVLTHGNGPQVGNLLVKNELAAAVVPPVPLDWCGAQTQATLGFVLMNALDAALAARGVDAGTADRGHPHPRRRRRPRLRRTRPSRSAATSPRTRPRC